MYKPYKFASSEEWKSVVTQTYPLEIKQINIANEFVNIYGNGSYYSNATYITDGGFFDENFVVSEDVFKNISKPVLIKSRNRLKVGKGLPHILIRDYFTYTLDISGGIDDVWKNKVKSKTRNQVRKGEKNNYTVKIGKTELLDDFYTIISKAWLDLGTPTHSKKFYKNIVEILPSKSQFDANFMILYIDGKPASGACLIFDANSLHHPYAATLKEFNKLCMNNVLYWEIIKFGIEKGCHFFDLGRSKKNQGTETYKLSWGAEPIQLFYYYFNKKEHANEEDSKLTKFLIECWKKLPLFVANFLGPKLIFKVMK